MSLSSAHTFFPKLGRRRHALSNITSDSHLFEVGNVQGPERGSTNPLLCTAHPPPSVQGPERGSTDAFVCAAPLSISTFGCPRNKGQGHFQGCVAADRSCDSGNWNLRKLLAEHWRWVKDCGSWVENRKRQGWVRSWQAPDSKWLHAPQWKKCRDNLKTAIFKLHSWAPLLSHPTPPTQPCNLANPFGWLLLYPICWVALATTAIISSEQLKQWPS